MSIWKTVIEDFGSKVAYTNDCAKVNVSFSKRGIAVLILSRRKGAGK